MRNGLFFILFFMLVCVSGCTHTKMSVKGRILDAQTKAPIKSAAIYTLAGYGEWATATDANGFFDLRTGACIDTIMVNHPDYKLNHFKISNPYCEIKLLVLPEPIYLEKKTNSH
jgi:hypothetical protein